MTTDRKSLFFLSAVVSWQKTEYPGIAKLVSRLVWERVAPPSSWKMLCPQSLDTPAIQALPPQAKMVKKTAVTTCLTTSGAKLNTPKSGISAVGSAPALGVPWRYPGQGKAKRRKAF